jgi:hypothetical protein
MHTHQAITRPSSTTMIPVEGLPTPTATSLGKLSRDLNQMETELQKLERQFLAQSLKVDLRGEGKASFPYVRSGSRAVEVSIEGAGFFIEYWETSDEASDAVPVKSEAVSSTDEAFRRLVGWLQVCSANGGRGRRPSDPQEL